MKIIFYISHICIELILIARISFISHANSLSLALKQQIFSHQIFCQARQSLSETVRFSDGVFWSKFCLAENLASIF